MEARKKILRKFFPLGRSMPLKEGEKIRRKEKGFKGLIASQERLLES